MSTQNVMVKVRALVEKSGLTQQEVGERMGYAQRSARQSVSQFLKGENPTISVLMRFAEAMEVKVESLL
jgi:transcriptional regulator with XRE-family HTH domain